MYKNFLLLLLLAAVVVISYFIFGSAYTKTYFLGSLKIEEDARSIAVLASELSKREGFEISPDNFFIRLNAEKDFIHKMIKQLGTSEANRLIRDSLWAYSWRVSLKDPDNMRIVISGQSTSIIDAKDAKFNASFTTRGELLSFQRNISDSAYVQSISFEEVNGVVNEFLQENKVYSYNRSKISSDRFPGLILADSSVIERPNRTDYTLKLRPEKFINADSIHYDISIAGNMITSFKVVRTKINTDDLKDFDYYAELAINILFVIGISIVLIFSVVRRIRAYEISFKYGIFFGVVYGALFSYRVYLESADVSDWQIILPMVLGGVFFAIVVAIIWAVSETVTRETWKDKLTSLDLISNGYFLHSRNGESVFRGVIAGIAAASVWILILFFVSSSSGVYHYLSNLSELRIFDSSFPIMTLLVNVINSHFLVICIFFLFIVAGIRKRIYNDHIFILVSAIFWSVLMTGTIRPVYIGFFVNLIVGFIFIKVYLKYDFFTILISVLTFYIVFSSYNLISVESQSYTQSLVPLYIIAGILFCLAVYSLFSRDTITEFDSITPAFVKNITERQRLQRELEIARYVQMSFLPKKSPDFNGLEISSKCLPALEVGGDYFDFVPLDESRLGVIVGDVSGKGTQAAFYMTLTKGFLKALSKSNDSTSEVLKLMNSLFYENVERGTFISMIYGIFDMEKKTFRVSRAGHNPVMIKSGVSREVKSVNPKGLALGLESGSLFNSTITEVEFSLSSGDTFLFYTDGFTEAMNRKGEEFGEERLISALTESSDYPSDKIMDKIISDVKDFIGKEKQHDDMTIVIVKVT